MLARPHRLTRSQDFATALRRGARAGSDSVVLHLDVPDDGIGTHPVRVGLVVGRTVGNAVTRNHVKRRLRHLVRDRLASLPDGAVLVIRALPAAAGASSATLATDLDRALVRTLRRLAARGGS